ncbi:MAG: HupE/UreJ family protein [Campylobacterales bacterium]|jgi:urease accessory protein
MKLARVAVLLSLAAQASLFAHTGVGTTAGFSAGFMHPIGGLDHVLAMVAVGLWAAQMGGRALWAVPAAFVGMMLVGGTLGISGVGIPFIEMGIIASVVVLGLLIAGGIKTPVAAGMAIVGAFAIFHGHAHGTEMPVNAAGLMYMAGFVAATALLHAGGIAAGIGLGRVKVERVVRMGGGAIAAGGLLLALA